MRIFFTISLLVFLSLCVHAQNKPIEKQQNRVFDGTWQLDDKYVKTYGKQTFIVTSADDQLRITKNQDFLGTAKGWELILFTDKRGEKNNVPTGKNESNEVESKTRWVKNELVRSFRRTQTAGQWIRFDVTERYSVSKDNLKLILSVKECSLDSPLPNNLACHDYVRTYSRQDK